MGFSKKQVGFTLIELVVVVAVLGVLAVFAIPKILGTTTDARIAALTGMTGALTAASTHNYMIRGADSSKGREILTCTDVVEVLHLGTTEILTADGYTITEPSGSDVMSTTVDLVVKLSKLDTPVDCNLSTISKPVITMKFSAIGIN